MDVTVQESENDEDAQADGFDEEPEVSTQPAAAHANGNATKRGGASTTRNCDSGKRKVPSDATDDGQSPSELYLDGVDEEQEVSTQPAAADANATKRGASTTRTRVSGKRKVARPTAAKAPAVAWTIPLVGAGHPSDILLGSTLPSPMKPVPNSRPPSSSLPPVNPNSKSTIGSCGVC